MGGAGGRGRLRAGPAGLGRPAIRRQAAGPAAPHKRLRPPPPPPPYISRTRVVPGVERPEVGGLVQAPPSLTEEHQPPGPKRIDACHCTHHRQRDKRVPARRGPAARWLGALARGGERQPSRPASGVQVAGGRRVRRQGSAGAGAGPGGCQQLGPWAHMMSLLKLQMVPLPLSPIKPRKAATSPKMAYSAGQGGRGRGAGR
jgi:hypothetical protein